MGKKGKKKRRSTRKTYPSAAFQWATVQAPGIPPPPPPVPPLRPSPAFPRTSLGLSSPIPRRSRSRHPLLARRAAPRHSRRSSLNPRAAQSNLSAWPSPARSSPLLSPASARAPRRSSPLFRSPGRESPSQPRAAGDPGTEVTPCPLNLAS